MLNLMKSLTNLLSLEGANVLFVFFYQLSLFRLFELLPYPRVTLDLVGSK